MAIDNERFYYKPVTIEQWYDLQSLFGPRGAVGGCWCMWWRIKRSEFENQKGEENRQSMQAIIVSGEVPGLLAYRRGSQNDDKGTPVGWCSLAPRETFPVFERSRILKPVDDQPVWSLVCFFVAKNYRRQGVNGFLLEAAIDYASRQGAKILEGYPVDPKKDSAPDPFVYTGLASAFRRAGFIEVERRSETRPIMRYYIQKN
jgi:GNAT superfamily N-acetyltransferase